MTDDALLILNAGSSSLKFALFEIRGMTRLQLSVSGQIEGIETVPHFLAKDVAGTVLAERRWPGGARLTHADCLGEPTSFERRPDPCRWRLSCR